MEQQLQELTFLLNQHIPSFNTEKILNEINNGLTEDINLEDLYEFISLSCIAFVGLEPDIDKIASLYLLKKMYLTIDLVNVRFFNF
jgi:hypothetical protein